MLIKFLLWYLLINCKTVIWVINNYRFKNKYSYKNRFIYNGCFYLRSQLENIILFLEDRKKYSL